MTSKVFANRANAARSARAACRRLLNAPGYQAFEGPDYVLHPVADQWTITRYSSTPHRFELRGPALEALEALEVAQ